MKKYVKIFIVFTVIQTIISCFIPCSINASSIFATIDVEDLDLSGIDENKVEDLKDMLKNLDSSVSSPSIDPSSIKDGKVTVIDPSVVLDFYQQLASIISNEDMSKFIDKNKDILVSAGINRSLLTTSSVLLRNFDANTVIDIARNDLDIDKIMESSSDTERKDIIQSAMKNTNFFNKIKIIFKLVFSNGFIRIITAFALIVSIYLIIISSFIFKKAGKPGYGTFIPIYRDIINFKLSNFSPWLLVLIFIPIIGWLALMAIGVVRKI